MSIVWISKAVVSHIEEEARSLSIAIFPVTSAVWMGPFSCRLSPFHVSYVTFSRPYHLSEFYLYWRKIWLLFLFLVILLIPAICSVIRNILPIKITYRYKLVLYHHKVTNIYCGLTLLFYYCFVIFTFHLLKRFLTGMKNLDEVKYLEMKVDTRDNSLGNFGKNY